MVSHYNYPQIVNDLVYPCCLLSFKPSIFSSPCPLVSTGIDFIGIFNRTDYGSEYLTSPS